MSRNGIVKYLGFNTVLNFLCISSGIRPSQPKRPSYRLPIIDPVTRKYLNFIFYNFIFNCMYFKIFAMFAEQDIFSELYSSDSQYISGDSSERQTPQPVSISLVIQNS